MRKKGFVQCMIKYSWMLIFEGALAMIVSYTLVQGNNIISKVIDDMLAGEYIFFKEFVIQFLIFAVIGAVAAFFQKVAASKYAVKICTEYKDQVVEKLYRVEYKYFDNNYSATLLNKVIGDLGEISNFLESVLPEILGSLIAWIAMLQFVLTRWILAIQMKSRYYMNCLLK